MIRIGEKIKSLRKQKNISQEVLANYLGVSFQSVSKWENGNTMPDVTMIPVIASFFGVSTDELFDFNLFEINNQVNKICYEASKYRQSDPTTAEKILREGLQRFPGNNIILNNLLYTMDCDTRTEEKITICKLLIESTKDDSVKYDACRILAQCYKKTGQYDLVEPTLEMIPEIYFTKLQQVALLAEGETSYKAAQLQKSLSTEHLIDMLLIAGKYLKEQGEHEKAVSQFKVAKGIIEAFAEDFLESEWFHTTIYEAAREKLEEIDKLLGEKQ